MPPDIFVLNLIILNLQCTVHVSPVFVSVPPTNVQVSPSTQYIAAFSQGRVVETFQFTCSSSGGSNLLYSWTETSDGIATNITSQIPGTNGKTARGSRLTIVPQTLVSSPILVTCTVVNPNIPQTTPAHFGQAMSSYTVKSKFQIRSQKAF